MGRWSVYDGVALLVSVSEGTGSQWREVASLNSAVCTRDDPWAGGCNWTTALQLIPKAWSHLCWEPITRWNETPRWNGGPSAARSGRDGASGMAVNPDSNCPLQPTPWTAMVSPNLLSLQVLAFGWIRNVIEGRPYLARTLRIPKLSTLIRDVRLRLV